MCCTFPHRPRPHAASHLYPLTGNISSPSICNLLDVSPQKLALPVMDLFRLCASKSPGGGGSSPEHAEHVTCFAILRVNFNGGHHVDGDSRAPTTFEEVPGVVDLRITRNCWKATIHAHKLPGRMLLASFIHMLIYCRKAAEVSINRAFPSRLTSVLELWLSKRA